MSNHRYLCWPTAPKSGTNSNPHPNWPATGSHPPARHTPQFGSRAHRTGTRPNPLQQPVHQTTCPQPPPTPTRWQGTSWNEQASQPTSRTSHHWTDPTQQERVLTGHQTRCKCTPGRCDAGTVKPTRLTIGEKCDPVTRNRALGTRFMCTECAQTLQHQSQLRGTHKTVRLTVHDRKDLFIRFAPI